MLLITTPTGRNNVDTYFQLMSGDSWNLVTHLSKEFKVDTKICIIISSTLTFLRGFACYQSSSHLCSNFNSYRMASSQFPIYHNKFSIFCNWAQLDDLVSLVTKAATFPHRFLCKRGRNASPATSHTCSKSHQGSPLYGGEGLITCDSLHDVVAF